MLKSSGVGARNETLQQRRKVILFLTDGRPTETTSKEILDVFNEEKESLKNATSKNAVIFAYGIGNNDFSLLKRIADDTEAEGTKVASYFVKTVKRFFPYCVFPHSIWIKIIYQ